MKTKFWAAAVSICFSLSLKSFGDEPAAASADFDARVIQAEGHVIVFYSGQKDQGTPARKGMPLDPGDIIKTDEGAEAQVGIEGDSIIELGPRSELTLTSLDRKTSIFSLGVGSLLGKVRSLLASGGEMRIQSATAVASVRGTEFGVDSGAEGQTHVGVFDEGKVVVASVGGHEVNIGPNQETLVEKDKDPEAPVALKHFKSRRASIRQLCERAEKLRKGWKSMASEERQGLRKNMADRQRDLERRIREKRKELHREGEGGPRRRQ